MGMRSGVVCLGFDCWLRRVWWRQVARRTGAAERAARRAGRADAGADGPAGSDASRCQSTRRRESRSSSRWSTSRRCSRPRARTGVCTDAPLRLFFDTPPATGAAARSRCSTPTTRATPVDSIDIAAPLTFQSDRRAQLLLQADHHQRQRGVHLPAQGAAAGRDVLREHRSGRVHGGTGGRADWRGRGPTSWRFTVRSAAPAAGASQVAVTADGIGRLLHRAGRDRLHPGREHDAGDDQRRARAPTARSSRSRASSASRSHGEDRNASVISYPNNGALQIPPGADRVDGDEVARDVRRRRQQRHRHREHHALEPEPAAVDQRAVGDAARRGRRPEHRAQRDDEGHCRTRC